MPRYNGGFIGTDGLDAPDEPTIGTPSASSTQADIAFTAPTDVGTSAITEYVATTNDGIGATGSSSPITITGLTNNTSYTARVYARNAYGTSAASEASASFTPLAEVISGLFSTHLYNGSNSTQLIDNGIDLTKGGMTWIKNRSTGSSDHTIFDSERGPGRYRLESNTTAAQEDQGTTSWNAQSSGFYLGGDGGTDTFNNSSQEYVSWTFRKQPKFFDVVTWSGNGGGARNISHNLGSTPGMMLIRRYDGTEDWGVYHRRGNGGTNDEQYYALLHNDQGFSDADYFNDTAPTSTQFTVNSGRNISSRNYIAYLFAHNNNDGGFGPDSEDIIKCGSYTGNGNSTGTVVNLGFEPQFLMIKRAVGGSGPWAVADSMRGVTADGEISLLRWNTNGSEATGVSRVGFTSTGFQLKNSDSDFNNNGDTYVYMAIRRGGMATPTLASDVFFVDETGSSEAAGTQKTTGFPVDMQIAKLNGGSHTYIMDRLRGASSTTTSSGPYILGSSTTDEAGSTYTRKWDNTGYQISSAFANNPYIFWNWRRARGYFDVVCYQGTGSMGLTLNHNLGVVPEMIWVKNRSASNDDWFVYHSALGNTKWLELNQTTAEQTNQAAWNNTSPTATQFTVGAYNGVNGSTGYSYVAYLFATVPNVSFVGSYTGDGSAGKVIDCGFTNGAKFVLIKELSDSHNWLVYDTTRGISSGNDPYFWLNTNAAENDQTDSIDPDSSGFAVNYANTNSNGETYIFYAIATDPS